MLRVQSVRVRHADELVRIDRRPSGDALAVTRENLVYPETWG